ncbi:MAG: histidine kinase dimerization/phospho-acceptor domain-containing protein [Cyanophyceae cyanobacterium]
MANLEIKLKQAQLAYQMVAQMGQFKAGFLARTAHELRSPISSLIGLHQLILSDLCSSPEEEREFLAQAYQSAQKLMKNLDEIVAVSKMEYGTDIVELQPLQLASIFSEIESRTHLQVANRNLQLQIHPPDASLAVMADWKRLLQVLINLVDIAIAYNQEHSIRISAQASEDSPWVQIDIDFQCSVSFLSEPIDLLQQIPEPTPEAARIYSQKLELSPGMKFWLAHTLLEGMQGHLKLLTPADSEPLMRLQCSFKRAAIAESALELG